MLIELSDILDDLRCPKTRNRLRLYDSNKLIVDGHNNIEYRIVRGVPVLIDFSKSIFSESEILESVEKSVIQRRSYHGVGKLVKRLLSPQKKSTRDNVRRLMSMLQGREKASRLLMIGGGSIGQGMKPLYEDRSIHVYGFDIYSSSQVQFVADAHQIPLPDKFFDAVVVQAVLEHVLQPAEVVAEIWRVLKPDGVVYAETPFMQQVHEGAYDFTRFTESGHRYLFRRFELISSGASGGPGTQFMWSADYLARGMFRSVRLGKLAKLAFFWTQYLDYLMPAKYAIDGASGVYFLGKKTEETIPSRAIVTHYKGAQ